MRESAVLTTAMSSMSIAVAVHTTIRVQRFVGVMVDIQSCRGRRSCAVSHTSAGRQAGG